MSLWVRDVHVAVWRCYFVALVLAPNTLKEGAFYGRFPYPKLEDRRAGATTRATKAFRPPELEQVIPARLLGIETGFELAQIPRVFLHGLPYYRLGSHESSKYPPLRNFTTVYQIGISFYLAV